MKKTYSSEYNIGDKVYAKIKNEIIVTVIEKINIIIMTPYKDTENKYFDGVNVKYLIGKNLGEYSTEYFWIDESDVSIYKCDLISNIDLI